MFPRNREERMNEERPYAIGGDEESILGGVWKTRPSEEVLEGEQAKESLLKAHHERYYGGEDPGDELSDDQAWRAYTDTVGGEA